MTEQATRDPLEQRCTAIAAEAYDLAETAAWLEERVNLIRPSAVSRHVTGNGISVQFMDAETMARAARCLMAGAEVGTITKVTHEDQADPAFGWVRVRREFGTAFVEAWTPRETVCERVVTGVETVEVPDPDAPKVTVERETVEWRCGSVLGGAA